MTNQMKKFACVERTRARSTQQYSLKLLDEDILPNCQRTTNALRSRPAETGQAVAEMFANPIGNNHLRPIASRDQIFYRPRSLRQLASEKKFAAILKCGLVNAKCGGNLNRSTARITKNSSINAHIGFPTSLRICPNAGSQRSRKGCPSVLPYNENRS